jgi:hypothetical protein
MATDISEMAIAFVVVVVVVVFFIYSSNLCIPPLPCHRKSRSSNESPCKPRQTATGVVSAANLTIIEIGVV